MNGICGSSGFAPQGPKAIRPIPRHAPKGPKAFSRRQTRKGQPPENREKLAGRPRGGAGGNRLPRPGSRKPEPVVRAGTGSNG